MAGNTMKWMLWPNHGELQATFDEFAVDGFRVQLTGNGLEVSLIGSGSFSPEKARAVADRYVAALNRCLPGVIIALITTEDFLKRTAPPFGTTMMTTHSPGREDRTRVGRGVREARNEVLASGDQALRRCYDHLQDAREHLMSRTSEPAYDAYKAMEVLIERFGGKRQAVAALGKKVETAKWVANARRHIPKKGKPQPPQGDPVGLATEAIRAYEQYLFP
jgi:hypothetical protein